MQGENRTIDHDEIARIFQQQDNVGADSSLWLRAPRQLTIHGKPVGRILVFTISLTHEKRMPFGMLTLTTKNRLVFWPVLPHGAKLASTGSGVDIPDHITLELASEKTHITAYRATGQPIHRGAWKSKALPNSDLRLWFLVMMRISTILQQDLAVQRVVKMPPSDKDRRLKEVARYVDSLLFVDVPLPTMVAETQYIYCGVFLASDFIAPDRVPSTLLPCDDSLADQVEGWSAGSEFPFTVTQLKLGQQTICLATGCPPGTLRDDVFIGFPRK